MSKVASHISSLVAASGPKVPTPALAKTTSRRPPPNSRVAAITRSRSARRDRVGDDAVRRTRRDSRGAARDRLRVAADDDDARAFVDQPFRDRQADAAVAAGDERHLAFETSFVHVVVPVAVDDCARRAGAAARRGGKWRRPRARHDDTAAAHRLATRAHPRPARRRPPRVAGQQRAGRAHPGRELLQRRRARRRGRAAVPAAAADRRPRRRAAAPATSSPTTSTACRCCSRATPTGAFAPSSTSAAIAACASSMRATQALPKASIVCPYHGWTYRLEGALRHRLHAEAFDACDASAESLVALPAEERHGLLWVVPSPDATIDVAALPRRPRRRAAVLRHRRPAPRSAPSAPSTRRTGS